jgi:hypothetical protein
MVEVIQGAGQSDFVAAGIDKGIGLRTLADALGGEGGNPAAVGSQIALAVGDTASDAPMLALGDAALVPAHAPAEALASGALRLRRSYQAGLSLAVEQLLGHRPGRCARCRIAPEAPRRRLLIDLFSIPEAGPRGLPPRVLRFVRSSLRAERLP